MRKIKYTELLTLVSIVVLSGCASPPLDVNYAPSSAMSVEGTVDVGEYRYLPSENGKVKPNQIRNSALGSILLDKDVAVLYRDSVFKELRFVGVNPHSADRTLKGEIIEFLIDDLGYTVDWTVQVRHQVIETKDNKVLYDGTKTVKKKTAKYGNVFGTLNEVIKLSIEEVLTDAEFVAAIK